MNRKILTIKRKVFEFLLFVSLIGLMLLLIASLFFNDAKAKGTIQWESYKRIDQESHNVCYLFIATDEDNFAITSFCLPQNGQPPNYENYARY